MLKMDGRSSPGRIRVKLELVLQSRRFLIIPLLKHGAIQMDRNLDFAMVDLERAKAVPGPHKLVILWDLPAEEM